MTSHIGSAASLASRHAAEVVAFLALTQSERYQRMGIQLGKPNHVADEVVFTATRRAKHENWPDEGKYAGQLMQRVYKHVRGHLAKNKSWVDKAAGEDAARKDFSSVVLLKLIEEAPDVTSHAENAFGDFVYKRCLDYADGLFAKKHSAGESLTEASESEAFDFDNEISDSPATTHSVEELLIQRESEQEEDQILVRIREIVQTEELLTDKEQMAFTYYYLGNIRIHSKDSTKLTVCQLMDCSDKSARNYIKQAIAKIKEQLK
jgi:hypothetical protein